MAEQAWRRDRGPGPRVEGGDTPRDPVIRVEGARQHNLSGVDLVVPHGRLTVFTGISGSGKSSMAMDTIHAEAVRRYVRSLSRGARRVVGAVTRPEVDRITGLRPSVAVDQLPEAPGPTSGTICGVHDLLAVAFQRAGVRRCPSCGREISTATPDSVARELLRLPEGTRASILALVPGGGDPAETLADLMAAGFTRVRVERGEVLTIEELLASRRAVATIEVVVDRVKIGPDRAQRLRDSLETALSAGRGRVVVALGDGRDLTFDRGDVCPDCGIPVPTVTVGSFSFSSSRGACPVCRGLGALPPEGSRDDPSTWEVCPGCRGARLRPESLAVTIQGQGIHTLEAMPARELLAALDDLALPGSCRDVEEELRDLLGTIRDLGLGYLSMDRPGYTLSGGELQRLRLASNLSGGLTGVTYVLDEPGQGLHPADLPGLLAALDRLKAAGNTVLVVEHRLEVVRHADLVVDFGPDAGPGGGRIVAQGSPEQVAEVRGSRTGEYLSGRARVAIPSARRAGAAGELVISGCSGHNLQDLTVAIHLESLVAVAGVSGSGKSSLVADTLYPALARALGTKARAPLPHRGLSGWEALSRVVFVDRSPLGRTARSCPATYTGIFTKIRELLAATREARARGYGPERFSFNVPGGRCEACKGEGVLRLDSSLLPDMTVVCDHCRGTRFASSTLEVTYQGLNVAEILELDFDAAARMFHAHPDIRRMADMVREVGAGYLELGQASHTLSGGENQRIKLARELLRRGRGRTIYILDEPTRGLHPADVEVLARVLHGLVDRGDTVVVVAHDPHMIVQADWVVELGPGPGEDGGRIVAQGTPEDLAADPSSPTGPFIGELLEGGGVA